MGYFQNNHDISLEFVNDLRKRLAKIEKSDLTGIESVVHFRGGDFNATNDVILEKYYTKSLKDFKKVLIITNDKNRAHNFFSKNCPWLSFEFTIGKSLLEEFRILTDARHITGSNSTFCWWAARFACLNKDNVAVYGPSLFEMNREYPRFPCRHVTVKSKARKNNK